jgi:hypothetical protein
MHGGALVVLHRACVHTRTVTIKIYNSYMQLGFKFECMQVIPELETYSSSQIDRTNATPSVTLPVTAPCSRAINLLRLQSEEVNTPPMPAGTLIAEKGTIQ